MVRYPPYIWDIIYYGNKVKNIGYGKEKIYFLKVAVSHQKQS